MNTLSPACQDAIINAITFADDTLSCKAIAVKGVVPLKEKQLYMVLMTPEVYKDFQEMMESKKRTFHAYVN